MVIAALLLGLSPAALADVKPPFGLSFGQTIESVRDYLEQEGSKVEELQEAGKPLLVARHLPQKGLESARLKFNRNRLQEVELIYRQTSWNASRYRVFFQQVRDNVSSKFGTGNLITKSQEENSDGYTETVIGYEWLLKNTSLELYYYSISGSKKSFYTVSLHYKAHP